jgi:hypothetical protein
MLIRITSEHLAQEFCQTDQQGKIIPAAKQTLYCAQIPLTCQAPDNSIDLSFLVVTEIALHSLSTLPTDQHLSAVGHAIDEQAATDLSKAPSWDLYRSRKILVPGDLPISTQSQEEFAAEITLTNDLTKAFQDATKRHSATSGGFERAKDFLTFVPRIHRTDVDLRRKGAIRSFRLDFRNQAGRLPSNRSD